MLVKLGITAVVLMLVVGCGGLDGIGKPAHSDATPPAWGASAEEEEEWARALEDVYERGYQDGRKASCDYFKKLATGEASQRTMRSEYEERREKGRKTYESSSLQRQYLEGWEEGEATSGGLMLMGQSC